MPSLAEIFRNLSGALLLLRGHRAGLSYFRDDSQAVWQSFAAAVLVAPGWVALGMAGPAGSGEGAFTLAGLFLEALVYAVSWLAFPVVAYQLCLSFGKEALWPRFVVALNWSKVWQALIYVPAIILFQGGAAGGLPAIVTTLSLVTVLVYEWFVIRVSLEAKGLTAAGFIVTDLAVGIAIALMSDGALAG